MGKFLRTILGRDSRKVEEARQAMVQAQTEAGSAIERTRRSFTPELYRSSVFVSRFPEYRDLRDDAAAQVEQLEIAYSGVIERFLDDRRKSGAIEVYETATAGYNVITSQVTEARKTLDALRDLRFRLGGERYSDEDGDDDDD